MSGLTFPISATCLGLRTRSGLVSEDRPGSLNKLVNIIRSHEARLASVLTCQEHVSPGRREAYVRIRKLSDKQLETLVEELKKEFKVLYVLHENISDIPKKKERGGE